MAKIDRVEDLPDWFDIKKYENCENYRAAEWYSELSKRKLLFEVHQTYSALPQWMYELRAALDGEFCISTRTEPAPPPSRLFGEQFCDPVSGVCVFDLAMQAHRDEMAKREGLCSADQVNRWAAIDGRLPIKDCIELSKLPIEIGSYGTSVPPSSVIQVNLGASDQVLKIAFANWLKTARASQTAPLPKRVKSLYDRWSRYGLLPYLDLLIWSMETRNHIPDRVMSAAISRYDAGEANLRKTVAPLAAELMKDLSELGALSAIEAVSETETFEG